MPLTIGVCGTNHPHGSGHLAALESLARVGKLLVWDGDPDRARRTAERSAKAEVVADWETVLQERAADAVVVLLPTREAEAATLQALQAGFYVYADKPGARTASRMREIVQTAEQTGAHYCPCYPWRVDPIAREIRGLIERGVLGDIWSFDARWLTSQVALRGPQSWLFQRETGGGGILAWLGCHWIDLLAYLLGPAVEVYGMVGTLCGEDIDVEDTASVILKLAGGGIGTLRAGYVHKPFSGYDEQDLSLSFEGSLGSVYWPTNIRTRYRLRTGHPDYAGISHRWVELAYDADPKTGGYYPAFLEAFLRSVEDGSAPPATEWDALYVLEVIEATYQSSREKRAVAVGGSESDA